MSVRYHALDHWDYRHLTSRLVSIHSQQRHTAHVLHSSHARTSIALVRVWLEVIDHIHCPRVLDALGVVSDEAVVADDEVRHLVRGREALLGRLVAMCEVAVDVRTYRDLDPALLQLCRTAGNPTFLSEY